MASLVNTFAPQKLYTPLDAMQDVGAAQNAMASAQLNSMRAEQLGRESRDEANFNALMDQTGGDYDQAMEMAQDWRTKQKIGAMKSQIDESQVDDALKKLELGSKALGQVYDDTSFQAAKSLMQRAGMDTSSMPESYDPDFIQNAQMQAMDISDRLKMEREERKLEQGDRRLDMQDAKMDAMLARQGGGGDTDKGWEVKETGQGLMRVNKYTGEVAPVQVNGQAVQGKQAAPQARKLSATAEKELFEADDMIMAGQNVVGAIDSALSLNDKAYSGYGAGERATIRSNLPGESEAANATIEMNNIILGQALESLKATFGAAPTEGERKILVDLQASVDKTPAQREALLKRARVAAERRVKFNQEKADALRGGTYQTQGIENQPPAPAEDDISDLLEMYK